jgi:hypothetical protein
MIVCTVQIYVKKTIIYIPAADPYRGPRPIVK